MSARDRRTAGTPPRRRATRSHSETRADALALICLLSLLPGCGDASGNAPTGPERSPVPVTVVAVAPVEERVHVRKTARLLSRTDTVLVAESSGIVVERPVPAGTAVAADAVIARLSDAAERARVKAARARLSGLVVESVALSEREAAEAAVEEARELLRRRTVRAPAAGIVDRYTVEPGDHVVPGSPVGRLVDPDALWCVATVLETEILRVDPDAAVVLSVPAWPGVRFTGRIVRRSTAALEGSGQFEVEVDVDADPRLRPGFMATVDLPVKERARIMAAPCDATFQRHGTTRVFVVSPGDGGTVAEERTVTTRAVPGRPDLVDLVTGVSPGERIVVRGRLGLVDGDTLEIRER